MHKHEWVIRGAGFRCKDFPKCGVQLTNIEVENRLNATEELPTYAAEQIADGMELTFEENQTGYFRLQQLRAYAERMEDA